MNIYFAGSIRAGRMLQPTYAAIVAHLKAAGHAVLSEHVAAQGVETDESQLSDAAIYTQDTAWLDACDAVVAEVTVPSLGVGYEIAYALHRARKPVLCLCRRGTLLSAMIAGNTTPGLRVAFYADLDDALETTDRFLHALSAG